MGMVDFNPMDETIYKTAESRHVAVKVKFAPQPTDLWAGNDPPYHLWNHYDEAPQREWHGF